MVARRQFLQQSVGAILGASLPAVLHAAPRSPASTIRLGFSLYGMKSLPVKDALRHCAETGYDTVELSLMPGHDTEPRLLSPSQRRDLRLELARLKLQVCSLMENLALVAEPGAHAANRERIKAAAELAHDLSPESPPILETVLGGKPEQWTAVKERMAQQLSDWAQTASAHQLVIAIKPHVGGSMHTPAAALWLHQQVRSPWIKLVYDYSHYELRGLGLDDTLHQIVPHAALIHVKDSAGDATKFKFLLPGEGRVDYAHYLRELQSIPYRGAVVVEVSGMISNLPGYDPRAAATKSFLHLNGAFARAGLRRA